MLSVSAPEIGLNDVYIRPTPFISITQNALRNKKGLLGSYYNITLTGTILPMKSSPFYLQNATPINPGNFQRSLAYFVPIPGGNFTPSQFLPAIVNQQGYLRELFRVDGCLCRLHGDTGIVILQFRPTVESINFGEGPWIDRCDYSINLRAEVLLDGAGKVVTDSVPMSSWNDIIKQYSYPPQGDAPLVEPTNRLTVQQLINQGKGFIEDYSESWAIEVDEGQGITKTDFPTKLTPHNNQQDILSTRGYRLTRNINVTGRTIYDAGKKYEAWQQAMHFIDTYLQDKNNAPVDDRSGYEDHPELSANNLGSIGATLLGLGEGSFSGFNHARTFSIDETAGSVNVSDTWILCSGTAYENYSMSLNKNSDSSIHKVSINGTIKGLCSQNAGSKYYGGGLTQPSIINNQNSAYSNAIHKYNLVSNSAKYGPSCYLYKRAQSLTHLSLNHIPLSIALSPNEFTGEIGYAIEYDNRPQNWVSRTSSESIVCSDTYPGDVFAVIPVLGRANGPVLQAIGGRTEYQRSLSIDLTFDQYWYSGSPGWVGVRQFGVLSKPTLNDPYRSEINNIITAYSPANELGIRKYFLSPPQEIWDAKSGKYTLNLTWTYELST